MPILQIPYNVKTVELGNSIVWLEDGIFYSAPKPGKYAQRTREQLISDLELVRELTGGKKICMIVETHPLSESPPKEDRDFIAGKLAEMAKAIAILTPSAVGRMVANLFFLFNPAGYPTKMFVNVSDARAWLKTCMQQKGRGMPVL